MTQQGTVSVKYNVKIDKLGHVYTTAPNVGSFYARSLPAAKKRVQQMVTAELDRLVRESQNSEITILGCQDGTILFVSYSGNGWGYQIAGPDHNGLRARTLFPASDSQDFVVGKAVEHARQSYGGIAWRSDGWR